MEKHLKCILDRTTREKESTDEEHKEYLEKFISEDMVHGTFQNLIDYMVDIKTDNLNPAQYNEDQKDLARNIIRWYKQATDPLRVRVQILSPNEDDSIHPFGPYELRATVGNHLDEIMRVKTVKDDEKEISYQCIDLFLIKTIGGA